MARFNLVKLRTRIISALIVAPLTVAAIYFGGWWFISFMLLIAAISVWEWVGLATKTPRPALYLTFGALYLLGSLASCYLIRDTQGLSLSVMFVCMIWSSDIGAFFTGKFIGGPKMAPAISPNKTWAGLGGAMFFPALLALIWIGHDDMASGAFMSKSVTYTLVFAGGLLIGITGQLGDLLMSFVKRQAGVKDSGVIIPGHGGLLDRIDALMLAAPVFLVLAKLVFYVP